MDFREFIGLAEALASGGTEAEWRTAVSRAYYGAFHVGCDLLRIVGFSVPQADRAHAFISMRLMNGTDDDVIEAGQRLSDLRSRRNQADYGKRTHFNAANADDA